MYLFLVCHADVVVISRALDDLLVLKGKYFVQSYEESAPRSPTSVSQILVTSSMRSERIHQASQRTLMPAVVPYHCCPQDL